MLEGRRQRHRDPCVQEESSPGVFPQTRNLFFCLILNLKVNGDWLTDLGDTISAAAQSVANTLGRREKTWDSVQAAFESRQILQILY